MSERILVVDDEISIVTLLEYNLNKAGYEVITATDGNMAFELARKETPDLILLDLMLPEIDGLDVCKQIRQEQQMIPIVMLTAKDGEFDKVLGLELGADDYIAKPFSPREVVARVKAVLRRVSQGAGEGIHPEDRIIIGDLVIYTERYEAYFRGEELELTLKQFELLVYLMKHEGRVLSRERLMNAVWDYDFVGDTRIVDVHVSHLRDKIEKNSRTPNYIKTIRGLGYKFEAPQ
ncbi:response regulator transcription factor [Tuberibacillus sp. Marseille-P3662]|uniref:response regulator transcription factor n=1 Tax=Tuberibacillus sp. Marseille-P3662 TaxID=1965358 RepID=UPI000A1CB0C8|nr:response regulator transcription factor [Tuberibacillus sp. Marseille-P3662]